MDKESVYNWYKFKRFMAFIIVSSTVLLALAVIFRSIFVAALVGLIFSYVLAPGVTKVFKAIGGERRWVVLGFTIVFFGILVSVAAAILPTIYGELVVIAKQIPRSINYLNQKIGPLREWLVIRGLVSYENFDRMVLNVDIMQQLTRTTTNAIQKVWLSTPKLLGGALSTFLVPIFTWFFLSYLRTVRGFVNSILPDDVRELAIYNIQKMDKILWSVVKGQLLVAFIVGVLYMLGFSLIGLQSGLAIGALAGLCRIVPYLDVFVGGILSAVVLLGQGGSLGMFAAVAIVIMAVQAIDGMFVTPQIIGDRAGIHPVIVIASVISFGDWFGILGVLLAVPIIAMMASAVQMAIPYYYSSPFYKDP